MSHSSVSTPKSSAIWNAVRLFSGANPRAPRWPCRSKAAAPVVARTANEMANRRTSNMAPTVSVETGIGKSAGPCPALVCKVCVSLSPTPTRSLSYCRKSGMHNQSEASTTGTWKLIIKNARCSGKPHSEESTIKTIFFRGKYSIPKMLVNGCNAVFIYSIKNAWLRNICITPFFVFSPQLNQRVASENLSKIGVM